MITKKDIEKANEIREKLKQLFCDLIFNEEEHAYLLNGQKLLSTTTFVDKLTDDFDEYHISENKAVTWNKEHPGAKPRTGTYYRKRWNYISEQALNLGSRVHEYAETYPYLDSPYCDYEKGVVEFFKFFDTRYIMIDQEIRVYNEVNRKAGTMDILAYDTVTKKLVIFDWKTGSSHILQHFSKKKLKGEFSEYAANNMNKYSIQLSDYANMLAMMDEDLTVSECYVIWLTTKKVGELDEGKAYPIYKLDKTYTPARDTRYYKLFKCVDMREKLMQTYSKVVITDDGRTKSKLRATLL